MGEYLFRERKDSGLTLQEGNFIRNGSLHDVVHWIDRQEKRSISAALPAK